jgi:hypothetical protein
MPRAPAARSVDDQSPHGAGAPPIGVFARKSDCDKAWLELDVLHGLDERDYRQS